jgi:phosphoribosylanthranilate isomerase
MWIKICGIRDVDTALAVARLEPDAIGLNFYARTPRAVAVETAAEIVGQLPAAVEPVGVFVNHSLCDIVEICGRCGLQTVQLHGDEPPEFLLDLLNARPEYKIIRACRIESDDYQPTADYLDRCRELGAVLSACLVDARVEGLYGGSGATVGWERLEQQYRKTDWPPLILAGGLTPDNVTAAIRTVHPYGVDVASGVESAPSVKDIDRVAEFIAEARGVRE